MMLDAAPSAALLANGAQENIQRVTTLAHLGAGGKKTPMTDAQMNSVSQDFESLFLTQMLGSMFGDSTGESLFGSSESKDIYKSLIMNEYGKNIAKNGGIGIASSVKKELLKLQEVSA
jgi:peptidoglycan hydrolase FlgJ